MLLQIASLHGDDTVIGGVSFREAVAGESFPIVKDQVGSIFGYAALGRSSDEGTPVFEQHICHFFGDAFPQIVGFRSRITGQFHSREHDLLLVNGNAVGLFKD